MSAYNNSLRILRSSQSPPPTRSSPLVGEGSPIYTSPASKATAASPEERDSVTTSLVNSFMSEAHAALVDAHHHAIMGDLQLRREKKFRALKRMARRLKKENKALKETIKNQTNISFVNSRRSSLGSIHNPNQSNFLYKSNSPGGQQNEADTTGTLRPPLVPPTSSVTSTEGDMDKVFGAFCFPSSANGADTTGLVAKAAPLTSPVASTSDAASTLSCPELVIPKLVDVRLLQSLLSRCIAKQKALEKVLYNQVLERRGLLVGEVRLRDQRDELQREVDVLATQLDETYRFKEFLERENSRQEEMIEKLESRLRIYERNPDETGDLNVTSHADPFADGFGSGPLNDGKVGGRGDAPRDALNTSEENSPAEKLRNAKRPVVVPRLAAANTHLSKVILALRSPRTMGGPVDAGGSISARSSRAHTPTNAPAVKGSNSSPSSGVGFRRPSLGPSGVAVGSETTSVIVPSLSPAVPVNAVSGLAISQLASKKEEGPAQGSRQRVVSPVGPRPSHRTLSSPMTSTTRTRTPDNTRPAPSAIAKTINSTSNPSTHLVLGTSTSSRQSRSSPMRSGSSSRRPATPVLGDRSSTEPRADREKSADQATPPPSRSRSPRIPPLAQSGTGNTTPIISGSRRPPPPPPIIPSSGAAARAALSTSPFRNLQKSQQSVPASRSVSGHRNANAPLGKVPNKQQQTSPASSHNTPPPPMSKEKALRTSIANGAPGRMSPDARRTSPSRGGTKGSK